MLSYSNRDFNSILEDLKKQIPTLTSEWTDFNKSDLGMVLLQTLAGISAMANFYIDKESNENFIGLAKESKNIESILELIGYKKPLRRCSKATQVINVNAAESGETNRDTNIILPQFFQIYDKDKKIPCFLPYEVIIGPDDFQIETPIYQGEVKSRTYSNALLTGYKFYLPTGNYAEDFFRLFIDDTEWEKVDNAFLELEGGRKFSLHRDAYDSHYILFTNDYESYIALNGTFKIEYVVTEGDIAIKPLEICNIDTSFTDDNGNSLNQLLTTYNKDTFTGGYSEADPYYERAKLQRQLRVMDRLVTLDDYNNYVSTYTGVFDCEVSDISVRDTTNPKPYQLDIFVMCDTLEPMSDTFKKELLESIKAKQDFRNEVFLKDAIVVYLDLEINFTTKHSSNEIGSITNEIMNVITNAYKNPRFKKPILLDEILSLVLRNVPEVYTIEIFNPTYDIYPAIGEIIELRNINVSGEVYKYGF